MLSRYSPTSRKIAAGWHEACAELGLDAGRALRAAAAGSPPAPTSRPPSTRRSTRCSRPVITGLLVHSDPEAMAVIDLALNRGISVPDDLSVDRLRRRSGAAVHSGAHRRQSAARRGRRNGRFAPHGSHQRPGTPCAPGGVEPATQRAAIDGDGDSRGELNDYRFGSALSCTNEETPPSIWAATSALNRRL